MDAAIPNIAARPDQVQFLKRRIASAILRRDPVTAARLIAQLDVLLNGARS